MQTPSGAVAVGHPPDALARTDGLWWLLIKLYWLQGHFLPVSGGDRDDDSVDDAS